MTFLSMYTLTARRSGRRDVSDAAFVPDVTVTWWLVVSLAPVGSSRDMLTMFVCLFVCVSVDLTHLSRFYVSALPLSELTMIHFGTYQLYCALLSGQFNFRNWHSDGRLGDRVDTIQDIVWFWEGLKPSVIYFLSYRNLWKLFWNWKTPSGSPVYWTQLCVGMVVAVNKTPPRVSCRVIMASFRGLCMEGQILLTFVFFTVALKSPLSHYSTFSTFLPSA